MINKFNYGLYLIQHLGDKDGAELLKLSNSVLNGQAFKKNKVSFDQAIKLPGCDRFALCFTGTLFMFRIHMVGQPFLRNKKVIST